MRERLGPHSTALLIPVDTWRIGELTLRVRFTDEDGTPSRLEIWPAIMPSRG